MASDTPVSLNQSVIYEVYLRNHTHEGTLAAFDKDIDRIKSLGVDIIWFTPIHPIGKLNHKGSLGCPYSIADYHAINPEYGELADFQKVVSDIHDRGMKVMIDVVYNHTSHDSYLVRNHPEFFHQDRLHNPITTVPEWSDVIDLKYPNPELSSYLIECLVYWSTLGVDGFRCDVASLVPLEFWIEARQKVAQINPNTIWLAESVDAGFLEHRRRNNLGGLSDAELYQAFDITYDYDLWPLFHLTVRGEEPTSRFLEMCRLQQILYPVSYIKLHFVENHDQKRIMSISSTPEIARAWTAFQVFNKGAFLIYAGQESAADQTPSLFDKDPVEWQDYPLRQFFTRLFSIKKHPLIARGSFTLACADPVIQALYSDDKTSLVGVFNHTGITGDIHLDLPDGEYLDLLSGNKVNISGNRVLAPIDGYILEVPQPLAWQPLHSCLLDTRIG
jgi:glycosidase